MVKSFECERGFSYEISHISKQVPIKGMTLNKFLNVMGERGRLIACMILSAPFLVPISIPGTGIVVGFIVLIISLSILMDNYHLLPGRILNREMSYNNLIKILNACFRILTFLEKYMKPRLLILTNKPMMKYSNYLFLVVSSLLFITPLPIPLTDTLPALGIFLLSAGILECDGYIILAGYLVVIITLIYFSSITLLGLKFIFHQGFYF